MERLKQASDRLPDSLTHPPKWLHMYGDFVTKNASSVSQIESALRSLTYIIPGRFRESEIASESLHSIIQLLSLYHDSLLARAVSRLPSIRQPHPSPHNRYTRFWTQKSPLYRRIALALQMIQYTELLCEMTAKRRGEKARWRAVVLIEMIKALCRLLLLRVTRSRPLLTPPLPERDVDPATLEEPSSIDQELIDEDHPTQESIAAASTAPTTVFGWQMPRTGLTLPSLPNTPDIAAYLRSKVLTADDIKPPPALLHRVVGAGQIAELLHILRPVIYALAMQRLAASTSASSSDGRRDGGGASRMRNWRPWLLGLAIEYGARQLARHELESKRAGGAAGLTGLEREEVRRRGWGVGWWVMRGAFYDNVTK
ncbi:MAG: hypothetical protein M1825_001874 [Sarcosagium campestre]|nr:MAG: hypothetical protein M1825_001874 [Sarcosagium campestre]